MRSLVACLVLWYVITIPGALAADPEFRSNTRLVQVNVVVRQRGGGSAAGLKKEDFEVREKGKKQEIRFFQPIQQALTKSVGDDLPPYVFTNRAGGQSGQVPANVTIILLDSLNTSWQDQTVARREIMTFLRDIRPGDRVALYTLGRGLRILHDYTSDGAALVEKLKHWNGNSLPDTQQSTVHLDDALFQALTDREKNIEGDSATFIASNRVSNTLAALRAIGEHVAGVPGRKSLIWVSAGFPLSIGFDDPLERNQPVSPLAERRSFQGEAERTLNVLNHADLAVYPVDARGLVNTAGDFAAATVSSPQTVHSSTWSVRNEDTMVLLADRTGGRAFLNRNDAGRAVREVFDESENTWTIGYYPSDQNLDGKWRDVQIRVNRPGLEVRGRKGYFALRDLKTDDEEAARRDLRQGIWSPLDASAVGINVRVDRKADGSGAEVWLQLDASTLTLQPTGDCWTGRVDIAFGLKSAEAGTVQRATDQLRLNLTRESLGKALAGGVVYHKFIPLPADVRAVRIVVRDAPSGLLGSITVPASGLVQR